MIQDTEERHITSGSNLLSHYIVVVANEAASDLTSDVLKGFVVTRAFFF